MTLIAYHQLENDTISAELSYKSDNTVHIVEQLAGHKVRCDSIVISVVVLVKSLVVFDPILL